MKTPTVTTRSPFRFLTLAMATATGLCALAPASAFAQAKTKTVTGDFRSSNGKAGTYVRTVTVDGLTRTEHAVFTLDDGGGTATNDTTSVFDGEDTRTVDFSHLGYGETIPYTSHKTVTKAKHGEFVSTGTYTTKDGDAGTLSKLSSKTKNSAVTSETHTSPTTGITQTLRLEDSSFGYTVVKIVSLSPAGKVTTTVHTRYVTDVDDSDEDISDE